MPKLTTLLRTLILAWLILLPIPNLLLAGSLSIICDITDGTATSTRIYERTGAAPYTYTLIQQVSAPTNILVITVTGYHVYIARSVSAGNVESVDSNALRSSDGVAMNYDINGDGNIDVLDIKALIDIILGRVSSSAGDLNGDGVKDIRDLQLLISGILGLPQ